MPAITVVDRNGVTTVIEGRSGLTVMEIIRDAGFGSLAAVCGGCCSCATCHVYLERSTAERLPAPRNMEDFLLSGAGHRTGQSRLSCQITFDESLDGLTVTIAPED